MHNMLGIPTEKVAPPAKPNSPASETLLPHQRLEKKEPPAITQEERHKKAADDRRKRKLMAQEVWEQAVNGIHMDQEYTREVVVGWRDALEDILEAAINKNMGEEAFCKAVGSLFFSDFAKKGNFGRRYHLLLDPVMFIITLAGERVGYDEAVLESELVKLRRGLELDPKKHELMEKAARIKTKAAVQEENAFDFEEASKKPLDNGRTVITEVAYPARDIANQKKTIDMEASPVGQWADEAEVMDVPPASNMRSFLEGEGLVRNLRLVPEVSGKSEPAKDTSTEATDEAEKKPTEAKPAEGESKKTAETASKDPKSKSGAKRG
ncbi:uncharacterized protein PG986_000819 [Apiospora aurea]|uniref:Uncharacterized protein n=1 Tax=Apiospora aurea TaxID=335848 RepID=A0ABR1QVM7_9PEZI